MNETYTLRTLAKIAMVLQLFILVKDVLLYWQSYYMIVSPIIPADITQKLLHSQKMMLVAMVPFAVTTFPFFWRKKYVVCIVMAILMLGWDMWGMDLLEQYYRL